MGAVVHRLKPNPLARGFYTVAQAARLIEVGSRQRIYGWLKGYPGRQAGPLLVRDYEPFGHVQELSFLDLMEVRLVEFFREEGVKPHSLRRAAETLRELLKIEHPFASEYIKLKTDKKYVYLDDALSRSAEETKDRVLLNLMNRQYESYEAIRQTIIKGVEFDPRTHLADKWTPRPERFPGVVIDPHRAYGQPIVRSGVPTQTLFDTWRAEGEAYDAVADWYEIPVDEVKEAVGFELALAA